MRLPRTCLDVGARAQGRRISYASIALVWRKWNVRENHYLCFQSPTRMCRRDDSPMITRLITETCAAWCEGRPPARLNRQSPTKKRASLMTGSLAMSFYTTPRMTRDIDLVAEIE